MNSERNSGSQNPSILNVWDPLRLDDYSPTLPAIGVENLTPVYPVDPEWLDIPMFFGYSALSLNGTTASVLGSAIGTQFNSESIVRGYNQIYSFIFLKMTVGSVSPIRTTVAYHDTAADLRMVNVSLVNPGIIQLRNVFVPNNIDIRIFTDDNGGAADTLEIWTAGQQAPAGIPLMRTPFSVEHGAF